MVEYMWISKKKYEKLERIAIKNQEYADAYKFLIDNTRKDTIVCCDGFIAIDYETYNKSFDGFTANEDRVKEVEAELEWYKVKYHEMKMKEQT